MEIALSDCPLDASRPESGSDRRSTDTPDPLRKEEREELLDDGQEEVFARSAVERGIVEDPKALSPEDLARAPISPDRAGPDDDARPPPGAQTK